MARVLVVDDTEFHLHLARGILTEAGHRVWTAPDGLQGLDVALREVPDLIVSDVVMPVMDGWELCEMVRSHPATTSLPFVFLTSMGSPAHRMKGLSMGADAYLLKPATPEVLRATVEETLEKAAAARREATRFGLSSGLGVRDLLVIFRAYRKTGVVTATAPGVARGKVYFQDGEALHASAGRLLGDAALQAMLTWREAVLFVEPLPQGPVERTVGDPLDRLLMQAGDQPGAASAAL